MNDKHRRVPRQSREVDYIPPARQVGSERPFDEHRSSPRPQYAGFTDDQPRPRDVRKNVPRRPRQAEPAELPENMLAGRNPIREALKSGAMVEKLIIADGPLSGAAMDIVSLAKEKGAVVQKVHRSRLDEIYPAHQGMIAYVAQGEYSTLDDVFECASQRGEDPFIVLLDSITDPYNLGAIIRSAECAGAHGVVIPERRASGLTPAVAKAAAGALAYMKVVRVNNINRAIDELKERGVWITAAALDGEDALKADLSGPIALVIGSEGDGISRLTLEKCDRRVTLPMKGKIESLNASVAAGILLYQVMLSRRPN